MSQTETGPAPLFAHRDEYYSWAAAQPDPRFELLDGQPIAMAPERLQHIDAKQALWLALRRAIEVAGAPCRAVGDGASVEIDEHLVYVPDALIYCGSRLAGDALAVPAPMLVAEIALPSSSRIDLGVKFHDYFRVPSIRHYLIIVLDRHAVIHHRRNEDGSIETGINRAGLLRLDPPGVLLEVEAIFQDLAD
jgi:Uma2 family endonuclease